MTKRIKKVDTKPKEASPEQVEEFVVRIKAAWQRAVSSIIETGKLLLEAKKVIPHGQWEALFTEGRLIKAPIPFSSNTAGRLMRIAENPVLSNPAHAQDLPRSWATLYELTGIPPEALESAIEQGQIHPDMQRKDVPRLHYFSVRNAPKHIIHLLDISARVEPEQLVKDMFECGDPTYLSMMDGGRYEGALNLYRLAYYIGDMAIKAAERCKGNDPIYLERQRRVEAGDTTFRDVLEEDFQKRMKRFEKQKEA